MQIHKMQAQKILLFGKGGQVGWELQRSLAPLGEVVAVDFDSTDLCGDFTNLVGLAETDHHCQRRCAHGCGQSGI